MADDGALPAAQFESASVDKPAIATGGKVAAIIPSHHHDHDESSGVSHEVKGGAPQDDKAKSTQHDVPSSAPHVYVRPKFSTSTEKEIRTLMENARRVQTGDQATVGEDATEMALFTHSLVQLLNAEFIVRSFNLI